MVGVGVVNVSCHLQRDSGAGSGGIDDIKLFYVRPVDGSGDRKILSPPAVVVKWKG